MQRYIQESLMEAARSEAEQSWQKGGIPLGAVLATEDGTIVARGHNQRIQSGDPTSHGETQCIRNAGRRRDWSQLTLVTTLSPCPKCRELMERMQREKPELWREDIGLPPEQPSPGM